MSNSSIIFIVSLILFITAIPTTEAHKKKPGRSRESDSLEHSYDSNETDSSSSMFNYTDSCNCTEIYELYNISSSSSLDSNDSSSSHHHSKQDSRKHKPRRPGGRHLGSRSKDSRKKSSHDSRKKKPKKSKLFRMCIDYCETLNETETPQMICETSQSPMEICTGDINIFECSTFGEICSDIGDGIYACCVQTTSDSLIDGISVDDMTFKEKINYYYVNNTGMFIFVVSVMGFIIIGLIIGFVLFVKKMKKNGYVKTSNVEGGNMDDIVRPQYKKNHERVSTVEVE